jgi:hypothetical protein
MSMDWDGESFDGEGEWPAPGGMEYDPWGGAPMMSAGSDHMHPSGGGNNGGGDHDPRLSQPLSPPPKQRARSQERERMPERRSRERSRERSPGRRPSHDLDRGGQPDWKRQRNTEYDSATMDLMCAPRPRVNLLSLIIPSLPPPPPHQQRRVHHSYYYYHYSILLLYWQCGVLYASIYG